MPIQRKFDEYCNRCNNTGWIDDKPCPNKYCLASRLIREALKSGSEPFISGFPIKPTTRQDENWLIDQYLRKKAFKTKKNPKKRTSKNKGRK